MARPKKQQPETPAVAAPSAPQNGVPPKPKAPPIPDEIRNRYQLGMKRLSHMSAVYAKAVLELAGKRVVGTIPDNLPGFANFKAFVGMTLTTKAEQSAIIKLLVDAGLVTRDEVFGQVAAEFEFLAQELATALKVELYDEGIVPIE